MLHELAVQGLAHHLIGKVPTHRSVEGRCRLVGVTDLALNKGRVDTRLHQMGYVAVAQGVRGQIRVKTQLVPKFPEPDAQFPRACAGPAFGEPQGV